MTDNVCLQKKSQHHLKGKKTNLKIETKQFKKKFFNLIPKKQKYPHNDSILNYNLFLMKFQSKKLNYNDNR
jgi:hypothetical protein